MSQHVVEVEVALSEALDLGWVAEVKLLWEDQEIELQVLDVVCDVFCGKHLLIELLLSEGKYRYDFALSDLDPNYRQISQSFAVHNFSHFINVETRLDLTDFVFLWERTYDERVAIEVALLVLALMATAWILIPQGSHDRCTVTVLNIR